MPGDHPVEMRKAKDQVVVMLIVAVQAHGQASPLANPSVIYQMGPAALAVASLCLVPVHHWAITHRIRSLNPADRARQ